MSAKHPGVLVPWYLITLQHIRSWQTQPNTVGTATWGITWRYPVPATGRLFSIDLATWRKKLQKASESLWNQQHLCSTLETTPWVLDNSLPQQRLNGKRENSLPPATADLHSHFPSTPCKGTGSKSSLKSHLHILVKSGLQSALNYSAPIN